LGLKPPAAVESFGSEFRPDDVGDRPAGCFKLRAVDSIFVFAELMSPNDLHLIACATYSPKSTRTGKVVLWKRLTGQRHQDHVIIDVGRV